MKKFLRLLLIAMLAFGLVVVAGCGGQEPAADADKTEQGADSASDIQVIKVGTEAAYAPFEMQENDQFVGFDMDIIRAIGEEMGVDVEIQHMEFSALIPALQSGKIDCSISAQSITPERLEAIDFSEPYFDAGLIIAVAKDNNDINSLEDLEGKVLAAQLGTIGADACNEIKAKNPATEVKVFDHVGEAFLELEQGRADAVVNDMPVTAYYVKTTASDKIKMVGEVFQADDHYGIGVKKDNAEVLTLINDGLAKIRENGKYDEIYAKWFE